MTRSRYSRLISAVLILLCTRAAAQKADITRTTANLQCLTDVMIRDITSPLVASRNYAYTTIAAYETARFTDTSFQSYAGQLNGLKGLAKPDISERYDWMLASCQAFYRVSYTLVFSKPLFQEKWDSVAKKLPLPRVDSATYKRSIAFGDKVAAHILAWAREDNYLRTRTLQRFTPSIRDGYWQQTPPDYMEAVEPYWNQIRPMALDSANQFIPPKPAAYNSPPFMAACNEVYETREHISEAQTQIANFWDCNPYATQTIGHLVYSVKKLSPGGHWIGIIGVANKQQQPTLVKAMASYSLVAIGLFDSFIAAWDEKFRSNYIRPVTAIQHFISPVWQPLLQTPPFPEYPSGHSVISMSSAVILSAIYGNSFKYIDYVERPYGIPDRSFTSFVQAANEAAISRLYGGIHFREAIENGKVLGRQVGEYVLKKITLKQGLIRTNEK